MQRRPADRILTIREENDDWPNIWLPALDQEVRRNFNRVKQWRRSPSGQRSKPIRNKRAATISGADEVRFLTAERKNRYVLPWTPRRLRNQLLNFGDFLFEVRQNGFAGINQHDHIEFDYVRAGEATELSNHPLVVDYGKILLLKSFHQVIVFVRREKHETYFGHTAAVCETRGVLRTARS